MKLYLLTIATAAFIISALNIAFGMAPWYYIIITVLWCTALQFDFDAIIAIAVNKMPDMWFAADSHRFDVSDRERRFYKKIKVKQWKDKVWELGGLGGFSKGKLRDPNDPEYIEKFIIECNKGVVTHRLSYPVGFLAMLTVFNICSFTVALPVALVNLFLNILPTLVLRYNTPMLRSILRGLRRRQAAKITVSEQNKG